MNWKQKTEAFQNLIGEIRERTFPYIERPKTKINWSLYDTAQCREVADVVTAIGIFVDFANDEVIPKPEIIKSEAGRPSIPPDDIAKTLLVQSYLGHANRPAEGLAYLFSERLNLKTNFSYKTIERGYDRRSVNEILNAVFTITNKCVSGLEKIFSVDGSGTPTSIKQNYARDREMQRKKQPKEGNDAFPRSAFTSKHDYVYKEAMIGVKYKLIAGWVSTTDHTIGETTLFPRVFGQAINNHPDMNMILGDGIFGVRWICKLVGKHNVSPRFLPRRNVRFKAKGVREWTEMLLSLFINPQEWLEDYHLRSNSEAVFSMLDRDNPHPLRKRLDRRRETEDYLRAIVHNIKRLCYLRYLDNEISKRLSKILS